MTAVLNMSQIKSRVSEIFTTSREVGFTSERELAFTKTRLWDELQRKYSNGRRVYSLYLHGYAMGLIDAQRERNYQEYLEFCYVYTDGTKFSTRKGAPRSTEEWYAANRGHELSKLPSGHFWIKSGNPYYVSESPISSLPATC